MILKHPFGDIKNHNVHIGSDQWQSKYVHPLCESRHEKTAYCSCLFISELQGEKKRLKKS